MKGMFVKMKDCWLDCFGTLPGVVRLLVKLFAGLFARLFAGLFAGLFASWTVCNLENETVCVNKRRSVENVAIILQANLLSAFTIN